MAGTEHHMMMRLEFRPNTKRSVYNAHDAEKKEIPNTRLGWAIGDNHTVVSVPDIPTIRDEFKPGETLLFKLYMTWYLAILPPICGAHPRPPTSPCRSQSHIWDTTNYHLDWKSSRASLRQEMHPSKTKNKWMHDGKKNPSSFLNVGDVDLGCCAPQAE